MRHIHVSVLAGFMVLAGTICLAQGIPTGSYQQTCNNVSVNGDTLTANCQDSSGNWRAAQLPGFQRCAGDVMNDNGILRCAMTGGPQSVSGGGPVGSYMQSCRNVHASGDDLKAECQNRNGDWHDAKLDDYKKCHGDIINDDAHLRCVQGAPVSTGYPPAPGGYGYQGAGPTGSYTQSCQDIRVSGDDLHARCQNRKGELRDAKLDDYRKCSGDIVNDDGHLHCAAGAPVSGAYGAPGRYQGINGPGGSYTQTCMDIHVSGDDLKARCQSRNGDVHDASLDDYKKCKSDIINDDGHLRCQK